MTDTTKRDHLAEGKDAVVKFVNMLEMVTELTASACYAAAEHKTADRKVIGKEVDAVLTSITAVATVGSLLVSALVSARIQLDRANEQIAALTGLEKTDTEPPSEEVKSMVADALIEAAKKSMNKE